MAEDQGFFSFSSPCPRCGGRGRIIEQPCATCSGLGSVRRPRQVKVRIPQGVRDGQRIRVKGRGGAGANGGPDGDLYVRVQVEPHPLYGRDGDNLLLSVPVTYPEAALAITLVLAVISIVVAIVLFATEKLPVDVIGILLVPRLLAYVAKFESNEMLLITVLGLCFGFCLLVVKLEYSIALGAFVIGAVIAESRQLKLIERLTEPHEVAALAVYLASPAAFMINGQDIAIDGHVETFHIK
mgnify:CR=1 FL=1